MGQGEIRSWPNGHGLSGERSVWVKDVGACIKYLILAVVLYEKVCNCSHFALVESEEMSC